MECLSLILGSVKKFGHSHILIHDAFYEKGLVSRSTISQLDKQSGRVLHYSNTSMKHDS